MCGRAILRAPNVIVTTGHLGDEWAACQAMDRWQTLHYAAAQIAHTNRDPTMASTVSGPEWNVEDFPKSYNGTVIAWDPDRYDTAVMPFIVAIKQNFWSWRIRRFTVRTGLLSTDVDLPSVASDGTSMITFEEGQASPSAASEEFGGIVQAMGQWLLDDTWQFRLTFSDGERDQDFDWHAGG